MKLSEYLFREGHKEMWQNHNMEHYADIKSDFFKDHVIEI